MTASTPATILVMVGREAEVGQEAEAGKTGCESHVYNSAGAIV